MAKYTPSTLFRGIRNNLLKQAFDKAGIDLGIDWEKRDPQNDKTVTKAWANYDAKTAGKEKVCKKLQTVLQLIWQLANAKNSAAKLCRNYESGGELDNPLPSDFDTFNGYEIGMYLYLHEDLLVLEMMVEHITAHDMSLNVRYWTKYAIDPVDITVSDDTKKAMATIMDEFFIKEGKGGNTQIETYPRLYDKLTYVIAKMNAPETTVEGKFNADEDFKDLSYIPPYEVIFSYNSELGHFMIHAPSLSKAKTHRLAAALLKVLTGKDNNITRLSRAEYKMGDLAVQKYEYPSMADKGYSRIYTEKLWIQSSAGRGMEFAIKDLNGNDAYETIAGNPNSSKLTGSSFTVSRIAIVMLPPEGSTTKKIRFELSEKSCTHPDLDEAQVRMVEELLDRMEIEA
jgi:hypothetical protein